MRLKRRQDIEWRDLPKIESPFFARSWVEKNVNVNGFGLHWVQGLDDVLERDFSSTQRVWNQHAHERLLEKVEDAEVVLVHGLASDPVLPVVQRGPDLEKVPWQPDDALKPSAHFNVEWMIGEAHKTRHILMPLVIPVKAKSKAPERPEREPDQLRVDNPRWEHVNEKAKEDRPDVSRIGDTVLLKVDVNTVPNGTRASFVIYDASVSPPRRIDAVNGKVEGTIGSASWQVRDLRSGDVDRDICLEFEGRVGRVTGERVKIALERAEFIFSF